MHIYDIQINKTNNAFNSMFYLNPSPIFYARVKSTNRKPVWNKSFYFTLHLI